MEFDTEGKTLVDIEPQPSIWPVCTAPRKRDDPSSCETPFVRRVGLNFMTGRHQWSWSPDCKHKIDTERVRMEYQAPVDQAATEDHDLHA